MADHYNLYPLKHFAATVAQCMDFVLPESYAPAISWVSNIPKDKMGGSADRAVLYHADAVGQYIWQKYPSLLAPVYRHTTMAVPFLSTVESVTPVAHASMYTGVDPEVHGIRTYVRPQLTCDTLYDQLIKAGKRVAIVAQEDSTFVHIFKGRELDMFEMKSSLDTQEKAMELIAMDCYDLISIHVFNYDSASHSHGPESKQTLNALSFEAEGFARIAETIKENYKDHRTLLTYSPDHGQHLTEGGNGSHGSKMIEDMNILHFFGVIN